MSDSAYGTGFIIARAAAIRRSGGTCQFCGHADATQAHHWARDYPADSEITPDDLTGLCSSCHSIATALRTYLRVGGSRFDFKARLKELLCDT